MRRKQVADDSFTKAKNQPAGGSSQADAAFDKAVRKALPPSTVLDDLARTDDAVPSP